MTPSEFTIPFSEFFDLWYTFATMACIFSIPLCALLFFDWKHHREVLIEYFRNYFVTPEKNQIEPVGCLFLLFFVPPIFFYHLKLILNGKVDPLYLAIHIFGFLAAEGLVIIAEHKFKLKKPATSPISGSAPSGTDDFDFGYSAPEEEPYNPEYDFDASRFRSKKDEERYKKYENMANDPAASKNERETAERKMIELLDKRS